MKNATITDTTNYGLSLAGWLFLIYILGIVAYFIMDAITDKMIFEQTGKPEYQYYKPTYSHCWYSWFTFFILFIEYRKTMIAISKNKV